jgi:hypothetical protein
LNGLLRGDELPSLVTIGMSVGVPEVVLFWLMPVLLAAALLMREGYAPRRSAWQRYLFSGGAPAGLIWLFSVGPGGPASMRRRL